MSRALVLIEGKLPEKYKGLKYAGILRYGRECVNRDGNCCGKKEASKDASHSQMHVRHLGIKVSEK